MPYPHPSDAVIKAPGNACKPIPSRRHLPAYFFVLLLAAGGSMQAARFTGEPEIQARPLSPAEALSQFRLEDGLRIESVAAEPLVTDPVDISFDEHGRLFVAEVLGYNRPNDARPRNFAIA